MPIMKKKFSFFIKTYGCQMNVHDSARLSMALQNNGFTEAGDIASSDLVIFITCSVRENARNKVLSDIGVLSCKENRIVALGGCVGSLEGKSLLKNRNIDLVFGPDQISSFPNILNEYLENRRKIAITDFSSKSYDYMLDEIDNKTLIDRSSAGISYISISQGCDNFCSYCVVPYARGRERSRKISSILREAEFLVKSGANEIILLGQNVNSFGKDTGESFVSLLQQIDSTGIRRLRFLTSHPKDLSDECINAFSQLKSLCPYLHLPVQSGSNNVLKNMNRKYSREHYLNLIKKLKEQNFNFSFGTDIIVGFPGETEEDFQATLSLIKEVEYDHIFSFKYSPRSGTKAFQFKDDVEQEVKETRLSRLHELQRTIHQEKAKSFFGKEWEILVESRSKYQDNFFAGRSPEFRYVNFPSGDNLIGKFIKVRIENASQSTFKGVIV